MKSRPSAAKIIDLLGELLPAAGRNEAAVRIESYLDGLDTDHVSNIAEQVYSIYPRKVGRRAALKAIVSARQRLIRGETGGATTATEADVFLLRQTRTFAESLAGKQGYWTPHPATWFNQSRYLDDPKEWDRDRVAEGANQGRESRALERARNNREAILTGLGFGGSARGVRDDAGPRPVTGRGPGLGATLRRGES